MPDPVDDKGLRLAREVRAAIRSRDEDLAAAIDAYDQAVTPEDRQAAAADLLKRSTVADRTYRSTVATAVCRMSAPELLPPEKR